MVSAWECKEVLAAALLLQKDECRKILKICWIIFLYCYDALYLPLHFMGINTLNIGGKQGQKGEKDTVDRKGREQETICRNFS